MITIQEHSSELRRIDSWLQVLSRGMILVGERAPEYPEMVRQYRELVTERETMIRDRISQQSVDLELSRWDALFDRIN